MKLDETYQFEGIDLLDTVQPLEIEVTAGKFIPSLEDHEYYKIEKHLVSETVMQLPCIRPNYKIISMTREAQESRSNVFKYTEEIIYEAAYENDRQVEPILEYSTHKMYRKDLYKIALKCHNLYDKFTDSKSYGMRLRKQSPNITKKLLENKIKKFK